MMNHNLYRIGLLWSIVILIVFSWSTVFTPMTLAGISRFKVASSQSLRWTKPVMVFDDISNTSESNPDIAIDSKGNAYAIWESNTTVNTSWRSRIYFSYKPVGGSWGASIKVNDDSDLEIVHCDPAIAVDALGNAYAVWRDYRNTFMGEIYFSYRPAGGSWSANVRVSDNVWESSQGQPDIVADSSGNAYTVWHDERDGNYDIYFSYRPAGGNWSANVRVNDSATGAQFRPTIGIDSMGNAYALWEDGRNSNFDIYFSYRPAGGSWNSNVWVNDDTGLLNQTNSAIAVDASGNAYAVWWDNRNYGDSIYSSNRPTGGSWSENLRVIGNSVSHPNIAVDTTGNTYALWIIDLNDHENIFSSYRLAGSDWESIVKVNDESGVDTTNKPAVATDVEGNAYALWGKGGHIYISYSYMGFPIYLPEVMKNYNPGATSTFTLTPTATRTVSPPPVPQNGAWYGSTSAGGCIHFDVSSNAVYDLVAYIYPSNSSACCQVIYPGSYYDDIVNNHFGSTSDCVKGNFTSNTHASGTWKNSYDQTGTWSANWGSGYCARCMPPYGPVTTTNGASPSFVDGCPIQTPQPEMKFSP